MNFRRLALSAAWLAGSVLVLSACHNVPDYLVEGRLPFGKASDAQARSETPPPAETAPAAQQPAPAPRVAMASPPPAAAPAPQVAAAPPPPPAEAAEPPAQPKPDKGHGWHLWPQKHDRATEMADTAPAPSQPAPPVAGGYQKATDKAAVDAAVAYALHESPLYELKGVKSASVQVVAGRNYALCLKVRQIDHEANPFHERLVAAKVFQGLDGHYELTSWQEVNACGRD